VAKKEALALLRRTRAMDRRLSGENGGRQSQLHF
jgi:hypothetical protein